MPSDTEGPGKALLKKRRIRTRSKVILAITIPVYVFVLGFFILGVWLLNNEQILPDVSIDGANISWLTKEEAKRNIGLEEYDARGNNAGITITFPDDSELTVTGEEVWLAHDANRLIDEAYSRGRGQGFIADTASFLQVMFDQNVLGGEGASLEVSYGLDTDYLLALVNEFTDDYNHKLETSEPVIYEDRVVLIKGAGQVSASAAEIYVLALDGLFRSLAKGSAVETAYHLPESEVDRLELKSIWDIIYTPPLSAWYDPEISAVSDGAVGVSFDATDILKLLNAADSGKTVTISLNHTQPEVTREHLENLLFRDIIGECVTHIDGTSNRLNNIVLACEAVDGVTLEPGDEFSFNRTVGRRTYERGYRAAPAFVAGETVQAIGGGICQVSSSIYSAIKDSDIKVLERYAHGRPVAYLPRGRDATVSWGSLDFRFLNNTEFPLRIEAKVDGRTLSVQVLGTIVESSET